MKASETTIDLDLSRHCIETAIRRRYDRCVSRALKPGQLDGDTEKEIGLLKAALESLDFPALRANFRELAGQCSAAVSLEWDGRHPIRIWIDGHPIEQDRPASRRQR